MTKFLIADVTLEDIGGAKSKISIIVGPKRPDKSERTVKEEVKNNLEEYLNRNNLDGHTLALSEVVGLEIRETENPLLA